MAARSHLINSSQTKIDILTVYTFQGITMVHARIFQSGNSQAVRLPKEFRFATEQVEIFRRGDEVVLREVPVNAAAVFDLLASLPADFMADGRDDTPPQDREAL
jgi:antitoxin VapB